MYKRYFRMKDPKCTPDGIKWIEMTGSEFYRFVNSPEGQGRHFIDMGDVVLEASKVEARNFKIEKNHSSYIQAQEDGRYALSPKWRRKNLRRIPGSVGNHAGVPSGLRW